jgi:ankyrin repeat protein
MLKYFAENGWDMQDTLQIAVAEGQTESTAYLLEHADEFTFAKDEWGLALANAARNGDIEALKQLAVRTAKQEFSYALAVAAQYGQTEAMRFLLEFGVDPNGEALHSGRLVYLVSTPLLSACESGQHETVKLFVEAGADVNEGYDPNDMWPLITAIENNNFEIVKYLIESGADVNAGSDATFTPLAAAIYDGQFEMLQYLVESGADVNLQTSKDGDKPIHCAFRSLSYNIQRYLLDQGADINAVDPNGDPVLTENLAEGDLDSARLLLEYDGIDFTLTNSEGKTALDILNEMKNKKLQGAERKAQTEELIALVDKYMADGRQAR